MVCHVTVPTITSSGLVEINPLITELEVKNFWPAHGIFLCGLSDVILVVSC